MIPSWLSIAVKNASNDADMFAVFQGRAGWCFGESRRGCELRELSLVRLRDRTERSAGAGTGAMVG